MSDKRDIIPISLFRPKVNPMDTTTIPHSLRERSLEELVKDILDMPKGSNQKQNMMHLIRAECEKTRQEIRERVLDFVKDMHNIDRHGPKY